MGLTGRYVPSALDWVARQVAAYEASGGTEFNTLRDTGQEVIIVTYRGKDPEVIRKIALMKVEHGGEYALVASFGGAPEHPTWYHRLLASPDEVMIQDGPEAVSMTVRLVEGEERQLWWDRAVAAFSSYADYAAKTEREIPIFVARRAG